MSPSSPSPSSHPRSSAHVLFRIVYGFLYFFLFFLLLILLLVTPADVIRQAIDHRQYYNVLVIAIAYLVTVLVVSLVYAARLYLTRNVLANIPKTYIPIDKGDLTPDVRKVIQSSLSRNAAIAWHSKPKTAPPSEPSDATAAPFASNMDISTTTRPTTADIFDEKGEPSQLSQPLGPVSGESVWGEINHPGWASPNSPDLRNLKYSTVVSELPYLIEAKALTLAPPDPAYNIDPPVPDAEAQAVLQRQGDHVGLREYLTGLTELGVLDANDTRLAEFITCYERARFAPRPMPELNFRHLMRLFAHLLRAMQPIRNWHLGIKLGPSTESDLDEPVPKSLSPSEPRSVASKPSLPTYSACRDDFASSRTRFPRRPALPARNSSALTRTQTFRTAPTTPRSRPNMAPGFLSGHHAGREGEGEGDNSSINSFSQSRNPYPVSKPSTGSLRSTVALSTRSGRSGRSGVSGVSGESLSPRTATGRRRRASSASGSAGSVIRLTRSGEVDFPYVLRFADTF